MDIQEILDFIEEHLASELNVDELATAAGYSTFYFYRLFHEAVGLPVMQYIIRRRLLRIMKEIAAGAAITDTGLKYGFATHSGLFKAFVREYGCSPSTFLATRKIPEDYRIELRKERYKMTTSKQIAKVLVHWELSEEKILPVFQPNSGEISQHVWQVGADYYLKRFENQAVAEKELGLLAQTGLSAMPLATIDGERFLSEKGSVFTVLPKVMEEAIAAGEILKEPSAGRFIGEMIGQLAIQLRGVTGDFPTSCLLENVSQWALPIATPLLELTGSWQEAYQEKIRQSFPLLPRQLIHRDLHGGNLLLSANSFTAIDFDLAEINYRIYDPCYYLTSVLSECFGEEDFSASAWLQLVKEVFIGYDQVVGLTTAEKESAVEIMLANQLVAVAYFSQYDKYRKLLQVNIDMTAFIMTNREAIRTILLEI